MKLIFNVGYPKCGSTTLQQHLFSRSDGLNDLAADGCSPDSPAARSAFDFTNSIISADKGAFERARTIWMRDIASRMCSRRVNVFSREHFVIGDATTDVVFSRLASLHEGSHVLFVVRPQHEIIRSLYDMYPVIERAERASGRSVPLDEYVEAILERDRPFKAETFRVATRVEEAKAYFGERKVHVFWFNRLFRRGEEAERLADLLEIAVADVHRGLAAPPANEFARHAARRRMRRLLGPIRGSWFLPRERVVAINERLAPLLGVKRTKMPPEIMRRIQFAYAEDNALLAELVPDINPIS